MPESCSKNKYSHRICSLCSGKALFVGGSAPSFLFFSEKLLLIVGKVFSTMCFTFIATLFLSNTTFGRPLFSKIGYAPYESQFSALYSLRFDLPINIMEMIRGRRSIGTFLQHRRWSRHVPWIGPRCTYYFTIFYHNHLTPSFSNWSALTLFFLRLNTLA